MLFDSAFLARLEQLHLLSRKIFRGQQHAERRSRQTGSSLEFADYRNYTAGDDLRTVDWNVYGRLNRLFVKLFEAEQDLHVSLLIDGSSSMGWLPEGAGATGEAQLTKYDHARRIAAALAYITLANLDRVNLFPFAGELGVDPGFVRGKSAFHSVLGFLRRMSPPDASGRPTHLLPSFRTFARRLKRRGLVVVLSDFFDPEAGDALALLRQQQFEVVAIQIVHPAEVDPGATGTEGGDLRLVDCESGVTFDLTANPSLLEGYRQEFLAFHERLERGCRERGIGFLQTTTEVPFDELVLKVLRDTQLVK